MIAVSDWVATLCQKFDIAKVLYLNPAFGPADQKFSQARGLKSYWWRKVAPRYRRAWSPRLLFFAPHAPHRIIPAVLKGAQPAVLVASDFDLIFRYLQQFGPEECMDLVDCPWVHKFKSGNDKWVVPSLSNRETPLTEDWMEGLRIYYPKQRKDLSLLGRFRALALSFRGGAG